MTQAQYSTQDGIAIITLANPPVNGLGHELRTGIVEALRQAEAGLGAEEERARIRTRDAQGLREKRVEKRGEGIAVHSLEHALVARPRIQ